jgi:hypothetical protein
MKKYLNQLLNQPVFFYVLIGLVATICLLPKLSGNYDIATYLWAEDGTVFANQAFKEGASAFLMPYAGYLNLIPRLAAYVASLFDLSALPYIFFFTWYGAYLASMLCIGFVLKRFDLKIHNVLLCIASLALWPNTEIFFTITNLQWFTGFALTLYCLSRTNEHPPISPITLFLIALVALTGPFSIFLLPLLLAHGFVHQTHRAWKKHIVLYGLIALCALIQLCFLMSSDRLGQHSTSSDVSAFIKAFFLLSLGTPINVWQTLIAILFWGFMGYAAVNFVSNTNSKSAVQQDNNKMSKKHQSINEALSDSNKQQNQQEIAQFKFITCLFIAGLFYIVIGLIASKNDPMIITAFGNGDRYKWVPFSFFIGMAWVLASKRLAHQLCLSAWFAVMLVFFTLAFNQQTPNAKSNTQFQSFAALAGQTQVIIPINPVWGTYPAWHIAPKSSQAAAIPTISASHYSISPLTLRANNVQMYNMSNGAQTVLGLQPTQGMPFIELLTPISCPGARHVGVEISLNRNLGDWVSVFWKQASGEFSSAQSFSRFYSANHIVAQFAFPNPDGPFYLGLIPFRKNNPSQLEDIKTYCLL